MSKRTLTDELRSVLLAHSMGAPEPDATVERVLADTVGATAPQRPQNAATDDAGSSSPATRRHWRPSGRLLAAASIVAVVLLAVGGINSARRQNSAAPTGRGTPSALQSTAPAGPRLQPQVPGVGGSEGSGTTLPPPAIPPSYVGAGLNCSTLPGGHLVTGAWAGLRLSGTARVSYAYEFVCISPNGQRSDSEVELFQQAGDKLHYQGTLVTAAQHEHVDFITSDTDSLRIQALVPGTITAVVPDTLELTTYQIDAQGGAEGVSSIIAKGCRRGDLTVELAPRPGTATPSWALQLTNRTARPCALEGFPTIRLQRGDKALGTPPATVLDGEVSGVRQAQVPPIVVLEPGGVAASVIEAGSAGLSPTCRVSDQFTVTLPNGELLGPVKTALPACGLLVHPLTAVSR